MFGFLRTLFGRRKSAPNDTAPGNGGWGSLAPGYQVTDPRFVENLSGVAACVSLISGTIAALPANVWKLNGDQKEAVPNHPLSRIIRDGSNGWTWAEILEAWIASTLLNGNGLLKIGMDTTGRLSDLEYVPWERVAWQLIPVNAGNVLYRWTRLDGTLETLLADDVVHLRDRLDSAVPMIGKSRVARSPGVVALANSVGLTAQSFQKNAVRPGGYLTAPARINDDDAKRWREAFDADYSGQRQGKTAVLGNGMEFKALSAADAESAQLVEQLLWSLQECARIFNVPPQLIGDLSSSTFTNSAVAARSLAIFCLMPWLQKISATFGRSVLTAPFMLELDASELLRGDPSEYFKSLSLFRNSAIITANEARALTGFDKHTGDDADKLVAVAHASATAQGTVGGDAPAETPPPTEPGEGKKLNGAGAH